MQIQLAYDVLPPTRTVRTSRVIDEFGLDPQQHQHVITAGMEINLKNGDIVAFTGPSGSGKSSLLRAVTEQVRQSSHVIDLGELDLGTKPLVDELPGLIDDAIRLLSRFGLGEPQLMVRPGNQLSEGQRYRFRLALAASQNPDWIVADEFTATLDRTLARVVAYGVRRHANSSNQTPGFLIATTHNDVIDDLDPNLHICCNLDGEPTIRCRPRDGETRKKKDAHFPRTSGSAKRPAATGRTSLGGITDRMTSG